MTVALAASVDDARRLRSAAVAAVLLARSLGPDTSVLVDGETRAALGDALAGAGADAALARLVDRDSRSVEADQGGLDATELAGRWVGWFDLGRVAPYEGSNVASTAAGVTPRLADIAGFYRALGLQVVDDRPDHVVAQLEFLAMALMAEAEATEAGDSESAARTSDLIRKFLRDHLGGWIDTWASRVAAVDELAPWVPAAAAAAELVRAESVRRNVIPLRDAAVLPADAGVPEDDEALLACDGTEPD